jgi:hypothetical protein
VAGRNITDVTRRHPTQLRSRRHACVLCLSRLACLPSIPGLRHTHGFGEDDVPDDFSEVIRVGPRPRWLVGAAMLRTGLPQV